MVWRQIHRWLGLVAGALLLSGAALADGDRSARLQYILHCTGCHQADGSGAPDSGVPSVRDQLGRLKDQAFGAHGSENLPL